MTEISRTTHSYEGNPMSNYSEVTKRCDKCNGSGEVELTEQEFCERIMDLEDKIRQSLKKNRIDFKKAYHMLADYILAYRYGETSCPECDGAGVWVELR